MITANIIADSISVYTQKRITTFELEYPRFIHAEFMTHRQFSRNSASSRAIPIDSMISLVDSKPAKPIHWGANRPGMQADNEVDLTIKEIAKKEWDIAKDKAVESAKHLNDLGIHKQITNRILEPFQTIKVLVTSTDYNNFFNLRCHKDAQPEIKELANLMFQALECSKPEPLKANEWHTPYVSHRRADYDKLVYFIPLTKTVLHTNPLIGKTYTESDIILSAEDAIKVACSCCAQISYRNLDNSLDKALRIYDKLVKSEPVHASALEHCAMPIDPDVAYCDGKILNGVTGVRFTNEGSILQSGNFNNWIQYRQLIPGHHKLG